MGWENVFHCEWNQFAQRVLKYYWPKAISYEDITKTDFTIWRGKVDILTGGFPCQPYSSAGKRLGSEDDRHLWPEMLRAIREIKPRYVVGENVYGITNWNGGVVFNEVQVDLENEGYKVQPVILPACAVNAPHRRDRVWFVANSKQTRLEGKNRERMDGTIQSAQCNSTDPKSIKQRQGIRKKQQQKSIGRRGSGETWFEKFPTQPPVCCGNDGLPTKLDGITFPKWRNESIKAYGNAIVPQIAYNIFKSLTIKKCKEETIVV